MHHLGNFSIRHVERVGPTTRAPPRGESVAPLSITRRLSVTCSAASRSHARGWQRPASRTPRPLLTPKDFRLNTDLAGYIINLLRSS